MNEYTLTRNTSSSRGRVYEKKISQQYVNKGDLFSRPKSLAKTQTQNVHDFLFKKQMTFSE